MSTKIFILITLCVYSAPNPANAAQSNWVHTFAVKWAKKLKTIDLELPSCNKTMLFSTTNSCKHAKRTQHNDRSNEQSIRHDKRNDTTIS